MAGPLLGFACVVFYAIAVGGFTTFGIGLLLAIAALLAGAVFGFVFAIPSTAGRAASEESRPARRGFYESNSNLEEISDWLTKILVGLGLVQFGRLVDASRTVVDSLASALGDEASSAAFAATVLIIFAVSGFLGVYILTRVYLGPVFAQSEEAMKAYVDEKIEEKLNARGI